MLIWCGFCTTSVFAADQKLLFVEDQGFLGATSSAEKEAKVHGHQEGLMAWPGITGTWGGLRESMDNHGITAEIVYSGETVRNFGTPKGIIYHDNLDLTLTLDTENMGLWPGGTLFVYGLRNHGGDPSADLIGDLQTASNIEAPNRFLVHEFWYEQQFADGALSILAGLHDLNSEFYVTEYGSLFLGSSFGVGPNVSANVPTSIFPKAAAGVRVRVLPMDSFSVQAAVYDGDPETRNISSAEGRMGIAEANYSSDRGSYKVGYWMHTADITVGAQTFSSDYGAYGVIDQELLQFNADATIGIFLQAGWAPAERNAVTRYAGGGLHTHGLVPRRDEDDFGIGVAWADTPLDAETAIELTYRLVITPWLALQPSFQWILNPGGDPTAGAAKVGLLRFEMTL